MEYYAAQNDFRSYIAHHGIKGQKWGVRNGPPYPLDYKAHNARERKANWQSSLSGGKTPVKKKTKKSVSVEPRKDRRVELRKDRRVELRKDRRVGDSQKNNDHSTGLNVVKKVATGAVTAAAIAGLTYYTASKLGLTRYRNFTKQFMDYGKQLGTHIGVAGIKLSELTSKGIVNLGLKTGKKIIDIGKTTKNIKTIETGVKVGEKIIDFGTKAGYEGIKATKNAAALSKILGASTGFVTGAAADAMTSGPILSALVGIGGATALNKNKKAPAKLEILKSDSPVTKRVKKDYNEMTDKEFKDTYHASKETYAKRVEKYIDPYMNSPLAKLGKKLAKNNKTYKKVRSTIRKRTEAEFKNLLKHQREYRKEGRNMVIGVRPNGSMFLMAEKPENRKINFEDAKVIRSISELRNYLKDYYDYKRATVV